MKKNFFIVNVHLANTGVGKVKFNIYETLKKKEINVDMLMHQHNFDSGVINRGPFLNLPYKPYKLFFDILGYSYFSKKIPEGYSLYNISSQMMGKYCDNNIPSVITCHDIISFKVKENRSYLSQVIHRKNLKHITKAKSIIFPSGYSKKDYLGMFGYPEEKTYVTHWGIDNEIFKQRDKLYTRESLGLPLDKPILLNIGSEDPRKNLETLFKTVKNLKKNIPEILLIRIGPVKKESLELIDRLNLEDNVLYKNVKYEKNNIPDETLSLYYNAADVFVFPSYYEGFGMPILESFSSGCPLVASNATSIPEITKDAALLSDPFDIDNLANNIEKILTDNEIKKELILKGLERIKDFSWKKTAEKTYNIYQEILNN